MQTKLNKYRWLYTSMVFAVLSVEPALAQLEEVVVTARKRDESLQDTPISITVMSDQAIKNRGINDASEIADYTPNLIFDFTSAINPTSTAASIYIRGVGQPDWSLPSDPGVALYLDDVYIARSVGAVLDVVDVENIEILRGPQGTLFGRNTIGGAISIVSKQPHDEFEGEVSLGIGRFSRVNTKAKINVPISDKAAFSAAISSKKADGFVKNQIPGQPDWGDEDSLAYRVALKLHPTDNVSVLFTHDSTREREAHTSNIHLVNHEDAFLPLVYNGVLTAATGVIASDPTRYGIIPDPVCADFGDSSRLTNPTCFNSQWTVTRDDPYKTWGVNGSSIPELQTDASRPQSNDQDLDLDGFSMTVEWDISDNLSLKSITAYREVEAFFNRDEDGSPMEIVSTANDLDQEQFTQELQLQGTSLDGALNWIVGFFYFEEEGCHLDLVNLYGAIFDSGGCIDNESKAVFAQGTYDFSDVWSLTVGARYTDEDKSFQAEQFITRDELFGFPAMFPILPVAPESVSVQEPTFHISLARTLGDDAMGYVSFSDSFKGATFTQRIFPPRDNIPTAQPEFVESFEIGFKTTLAENRVRLNGAFFFSDYEDIQVTVLEEDQAGNTTANAASGEIKGFELELYASPVPQMAIELGVGYLDAEYSEVGGIAQAAGLTADMKFVNTPELSMNSAIEYDFALSNGWTMTPRLEYNWNDKIYNDTQNFVNVIQDSVGLFNASIRLESSDGKWIARLHGRNLGDKLVIISGFSDPNFSGSSEVTVIPPRTYMATVEYNF